MKLLIAPTDPFMVMPDSVFEYMGRRSYGSSRGGCHRMLSTIRTFQPSSGRDQWV